MKLAELEPRFVRHKVRDAREFIVEAADLADAQGVQFLCPKCSAHYVLVWFRGRGVPDGAEPGPGRWAVSGSSLADLSLSPSIHLRGGCGWHGFVTNGSVTTC